MSRIPIKPSVAWRTALLRAAMDLLDLEPAVPTVEACWLAICSMQVTEMCQLNQTMGFLSVTYCKTECWVFWNVMHVERSFLTFWRKLMPPSSMQKYPELGLRLVYVKNKSGSQMLWLVRQKEESEMCYRLNGEHKKTMFPINLWLLPFGQRGKERWICSGLNRKEKSSHFPFCLEHSV